MGTEYRMVGIEDSDGDACDCCGTACPKRRIVLEPLNDAGNYLRLGSTCAALALGSKSSTIGKAEASALKRARRILDAGYTREQAAEALMRLYFLYLHPTRMAVSFRPWA